MDQYQIKIRKLEHDILLHPEMHSVRSCTLAQFPPLQNMELIGTSPKSVHILSGDLILHKRTLDPIKTMIYGLRRYDLDRCMAIANLVREEEEEQDDYDMSAAEGGANDSNGEKWKRRRRRHRAKGVRRDLGQQREKGEAKVKGYFSYKAKVYLVRNLLTRRRIGMTMLTFVAQADVNDHIDFALTCLDMFSGISENLINYAFNVGIFF